MSIKVTYITTGGEEKQAEFELDATYVDLSGKQLKTVDLTPLKSLPHLQSLDLRQNNLQSIDLTPLSFCKDFSRLLLYNNQLQSIDLTPLSSCKNLSVLGLSSNNLQTVDLTPLSSCVDLYEVSIAENQFSYIELTPLSSCINLTAVNFYENPLQNIDVTPLCLHNEVRILADQERVSWLRPTSKEFGRTVYSRPIQQCPWSFLYRVVREYGNDFRVKNDILAALGLADYGFIHRDLTDIFHSIPPETPDNEARELLIKTLVEDVVTSVKYGGVTTGQNLKVLSGRHTEIAALEEHIIKLRKKEIRSVGIREYDRRFSGIEVDLSNLWLTALGYEVLSSLDKGKTTNMAGFEQVQEAAAKIGLKLKINTSTSYGVAMGFQEKECIWWIVENRGKPWSEIRGK